MKRLTDFTWVGRLQLLWPKNRTRPIVGSELLASAVLQHDMPNFVSQRVSSTGVKSVIDIDNTLLEISPPGDRLGVLAEIAEQPHLPIG